VGHEVGISKGSKYASLHRGKPLNGGFFVKPQREKEEFSLLYSH
jgi:hypothetical protein